MLLITPKNKISSMKARALVELSCLECKQSFFRPKNQILKVFKGNPSLTFDFCSRKCYGLNKTKTHSKIVKCKNCNKEFRKKNGQIKKTSNHFCNSSCSAIFNNVNKSHGTRRSKLEKYIEKQLKIIYPNLEIHFNQKDAINSELDIYIPSLKLAFELNGIFHYEPIYGQEKLAQIQNNDDRKFQACLEKGIELCIINTRSQHNFSKDTSKKFFSVIESLINKKLGE